MLILRELNFVQKALAKKQQNYLENWIIKNVIDDVAGGFCYTIYLNAGALRQMVYCL